MFPVPLKFHQNRVGNSGDIANICKVISVSNPTKIILGWGWVELWLSWGLTIVNSCIQNLVSISRWNTYMPPFLFKINVVLNNPCPSRWKRSMSYHSLERGRARIGFLLKKLHKCWESARLLSVSRLRAVTTTLPRPQHNTTPISRFDMKMTQTQQYPPGASGEHIGHN